MNYYENPPVSPPVPVYPFFRVLLTKLAFNEWQILPKPVWDDTTRALSRLLDNEENTYAEFYSGCTPTRMVRLRDLAFYVGNYQSDPTSLLDPRDANHPLPNPAAREHFSN